jgi:hypothetical protein
MALQVIATHAGGLVLDSSGDLVSGSYALQLIQG